jgi:hypothetical protein
MEGLTVSRSDQNKWVVLYIDSTLRACYLITLYCLRIEIDKIFDRTLTSNAYLKMLQK